MINIRGKFSYKFHSASIRMKLIVAFSVPIFLIMFLGTVSYMRASDGISNSYENSTSQAINMTGEYLSLGTNSILDVSTQYINDNNMKKYFTGMLKNDVLEYKNTKNTLNNAVLAKETTDDFISDISIFSDNVFSITTTNTQNENISSGYYETETGKLIKNNLKVVWLGKDTFLDEKLGTDSNSYALRLVRSLPGSDGLIVIDMDIKSVLDILQRMEFDKAVTIGMVTPDGKEIISGSQSADNSIIFADKDFYKDAAISEKQNGSFYVDYNGEQNLFLYTKLSDTGAIICAMVPKSTILGQTNSIKSLTFVIVLISCAIAVVIGLYISSGIDKTIKSIIAKLKKAANGDLTVDFSTKRKDEFRILMDEINHTFANMKDLISRVKLLSSDVSNASLKVADTSEVFLKTTDDISLAMDEIEKGVMQQAKDAEECLHQMDNLSNKLITMNGSTEMISRIADDTKKSISEGTIVTKDLNNQTILTIEITTDIVKGIEELSEKSKSIGSIINVINEISNQTNLLSLNASIEAARAGVLGNGFAVVATEIRNLAEQTSRQVNDIKKIVENIQNETKVVVITAKKAEEAMVLQDKAVKNTMASYHNINQSVDNLMLHLKNIVDNVENIEDARVSTLGAIENISAVLEEIAASTNNVHQTSSDQLNSVEFLNQSAGYLKDNSEHLVQAVHNFIV